MSAYVKFYQTPQIKNIVICIFLYSSAKVNMGNIYFKMGEHPKALKLYRMALDQTPTAEKDLRYVFHIFC